MLPCLLTFSGIQNFYLSEPKFNGCYSRNWLPKINDGIYVKYITTNPNK